MRIGFGLPVGGKLAGPESIVKVAQEAEKSGFDTLWVHDRLLYPVNLQTPYMATPDGSLPEQPYKVSLDPLDTLNWAAAHTNKIGIGTSILILPIYNPIKLARRLTTIDVLSGGRLRVGLGLGWSKDEYDAAGASMENRGKQADEFLQVLKAIWTTDPAEFSGEFYNLPKSHILPKPVQKPHPPVYLAAFSPGGLKRVATMTNGWNPVGVPVDGMQQMMGAVRGMAQEAGRDPNELEMVVRGHPMITPDPMPDDQRWIFAGSRDQIKADIDATRELGATEIFFDPSMAAPVDVTVDHYLDIMGQIKELAG